MKLRIGEKFCGDNEPALMFAEEGQANQGDFKLALKMIELAAGAGADGIEFQLFLAEDLYVLNSAGYQLYLKRELSGSQIGELVSFAKKKGILFQAACLSPKIAELCANAEVDAFCINATDLNNPIMLDAISSLGKPFWLAALMADMNEIDWAVEHLNGRGAVNYGLLHGQHVMSSGNKGGVPPEIAQLDCISMLKKRYGLAVGYVDHTPTIHMPAISAAKGANVVMKHLAPQTGWEGPDWAIALPPDQWKTSKELFNYSVLTAGELKDLSISELKDRSLHRRSLYTARCVETGSVLSREDLIALRPGKGGMDPRNIEEIIGKKVKHTLASQHMLQENDLY